MSLRRSGPATPRSNRLRSEQRPDGALLTFGVLAMVFGTFFAIVTPTFWGADEAQHVSRVYSITTGNIVPAPIADARGSNFGGGSPGFGRRLECMVTTNYRRAPEASVRTDRRSQGPGTAHGRASRRTGRERWASSTTVIYSPIAYAPRRPRDDGRPVSRHLPSEELFC